MAGSLCRVCLIGNIRMLYIDNSHLLEVYEKLTNTKLNTELGHGMPKSICFVCHWQLQKCYKFSNTARRSNRILQKLLQNSTKVSLNAASMQSLDIKQNLTLSLTKCISIDSYSDVNSIPVTVMEEHIKEETTTNIEMEFAEFKFEPIDEVPAFSDGSNTTEMSIENVNDGKNLKYDKAHADKGGLTEGMLVQSVEMPYSNIPDSLFLNPATVDNHSNTESMPPLKEEQVIVKEEVMTENVEIEFEGFNFGTVNAEIGKGSTQSLENVNAKNHKNQACTVKGDLTKGMLNPSADKPYSCNSCDKTFARKANLKIHMLVHSGERAYSCNVCDKTCSRKADLKKHMFVHTGVKPFSCDRCDKVFTRKGGLTNHMLVHTGERAHSCSECGKAFKVKSNLTRHLLTHTGQRPYSCNICDVAFSRQNYLKVHLLNHIHDNYSCERCDEKFTLKANLKVHAQIHNDTACYSCYSCDETFKKIEYLTSHMLIHARGKDQI